VRKLAILIVRHRWWVLVGTVVVITAAALIGGGVHDRLSSGGFEDLSTESARAKAELKRNFPQASLSDFVLVVTTPHGHVDDPAVEREATKLVKDLARRRGILAVGSYWTYGKVEQLRSRNSRQALSWRRCRARRTLGSSAPVSSRRSSPCTTRTSRRRPPARPC
jgi:RND superfamily putative drug exporter